MNIMLCLVSSQHVPNLLSVNHCRPDVLVLLESKAMEEDKRADRLLSALRIGGIHYARSPSQSESQKSVGIPSKSLAHVVALDRVDDFVVVTEALQKVYSQYIDDTWTVNLTGGNKLMALAAYDFFKAKGARLCYIEHEKPRDLIPLSNGQHRETCTHHLTIAEFLAGYGFELSQTEAELKQQQEHDNRLWETARVIAQHATADDLFDFDDKERDKVRNHKQFVLYTKHLAPLAPPVRAALETCFGLDSNGSIVLDKKNRAGDFVTGGWLEVFIWGILAQRAEKLEISDVQHGVKPHRVGDSTANDLDVAFVDHNLALVMVECKSGKQNHAGASDIIYKVDSVIGQSNALKARAILATTSDFLFDTQQPGELKKRVKELKDLLKLTVVTRDQIQDLANNPDNDKLIETTFLR